MRRLGILLVLLFVGCSPTIYSGRVTEKKFIPRHWETRTEYKYNAFTQQNEWVDHRVFVPDQYLIEICNYTEQDRKFMCKTLEISHEKFNELKVGDWYIPQVEK